MLILESKPVNQDNKIKVQSYRVLLDGNNFVLKNFTQADKNKLLELQAKPDDANGKADFQKYCNSINATNMFMNVTKMLDAESSQVNKINSPPVTKYEHKRKDLI